MPSSKGANLVTVLLFASSRTLTFNDCRYENEDVALNTGMILKEMLRYEPLAKILLHSEEYVPFASRLSSVVF